MSLASNSSLHITLFPNISLNTTSITPLPDLRANGTILEKIDQQWKEKANFSENLAEKSNSLNGKVQFPENIGTKSATLKAESVFKSNPSSPSTPFSELPSDNVFSLKEFIEDPSFPAIDDKLFQHILGDHFGKDTGFEDYEDEHILQYLLTIFQKIKPLNRECLTKSCEDSIESEKQAFNRIIGHFEVAKEINKAFVSPFPDFYDALIKQIKKLEPGERFFWQGGWGAKEGDIGHSIIYEISKETSTDPSKKDLFTLRFYNRGAGLEYHVKRIIDEAKYSLPFTEIVHIPLDNLVAHPLWQALHEFKQPPQDNHPWQAHHLHQIILPKFGGQISTRKYTLEQVLENLDVGHCSYLSLTGLIQQQLFSNSFYQRWEFQLQFVTLWNFFKQHKGELYNNEETRLLLQKGMQFFARKAASANRNGHISSEDTKLVNLKCDEIKDALKEIKYKKQQQGALQSSPSFKFDTDYFVWEKFLTTLPKRDFSKAFSSIPIETDEKGQFTGVKKNLDKIHEQFLEILSKGQVSRELFLSFKEAIQEIIRKIPFEENKREAFFSKLSFDEKKDMISLLGEIGKDYLWCIMYGAHFEPKRQAWVLPADYLTAVKLLTLADYISNTCHSEDPFNCLKLPDLFQWDMGHMLAGRSGETQLFHPEWEENLLHLGTYWQERVKTNKTNYLSFFGFEQMPASTAINRYKGGASSFMRQAHVESSMRYGWDNAFDWKDLTWASEWVSQRDIFDKIKHYSVKLSEKTPLKQAITFLYDLPVPTAKRDSTGKEVEKPEIFPKTLFALHDLSFVVDFLLKNNWDPSTIKTPHARFYSFFAVAKEEDKEDSGHWRIGAWHPFALKHPEKSENDESFNPHNIEIFIEKNRPMNFNANEALANAQESLTALLKPFHVELVSFIEPIHTKAVNATFRRRLEPHHQLTLLPSDVIITNPLSLQESRELLALSGIPSQQIQETLAYFKRHKSSLKEGSYQLLFKKLIFEPPLLVSKLLENPKEAQRFSKELAKFCKESFRFYLGQNDYVAANFFLEINYLFARTAEHLSTTYPKQFTKYPLAKFLDSKSELQNLLATIQSNGMTVKEKENLRTLLSLTRLQIYATEAQFKTKDISDFLACALWVQKSAQNENSAYFSKSKYFAVRDLTYRFQNKISVALDSSERDRILNGVASRLQGKPIKWQWEKEDSTYVSKEGNIRYSPLQAHWLDSSLAGKSNNMPLPYNLRSQVEKITGVGSGQEVRPGYFKGENARKEKYEFIDIGEGKEPIIRREFGAKWYKKVNNAPILVPNALKAHHFWVEDEFGFFDGFWYYLWELQKNLLFTDPENGRLLYEGVLSVKKSENSPKGYLTDYQPLHIYALDDKGERTSLVLANIQQKGLDVFKRFEEASYILAWADIYKKELKKISLPRFDLSFSIEGNKVHCESLKGYDLSENQYVADLDGLSHYFVLQKNEEKTVLFPRVELKKQVHRSLHTEGLVEYPIGAKIPYLKYDLTSDGNVMLPKVDESRFYLAFMRLWKHEYMKAFHTLVGMGSQIKLYSKEEAEILSWIAKLGKKNFDADPSANAIRLKAGLLLLKNEEEFGEKIDLEYVKKNKDLLKAISDEAIRVRQKREQIPKELKLSEIEEKFLRNTLSRIEDLEELLKAQNNILAIQKGGKAEFLSIEETKKLWLDEIKIAWDKGVQEVMEKIFSTQFFRQWDGPRESNPVSLLSSQHFSKGFLETYGIIEKYKLNKSFKSLKAKTEQRKYLKDLYLKVTGYTPLDGFSVEKTERELKIALELVFRGTSEVIERATAGIMLALLTHESPISKPQLSAMLKNSEDLELCFIFGQFLREFIETLPPFNPELSKDNSLIEFIPPYEKPPERRSVEYFGQCSLNPFDFGKALPSVGPETIVDVEPSIMLDNKLKADGDNLKKVFQVSVKDQAITSAMTKLGDNIDKFVISPKAQPRKHQRNTTAIQEKIDRFLPSVTAAMSVFKRKAEQTKIELLELAQQNTMCRIASPEFLWNSQQALQLHLLEETYGDSQPLQLDELLYLFIGGDKDQLLRRDPNLSPQEIEKIYILTHKFLLEATNWQHLDRIKTKMKETNKALGALHSVQKGIKDRKDLIAKLEENKNDIYRIGRTDWWNVAVTGTVCVASLAAGGPAFPIVVCPVMGLFGLMNHYSNNRRLKEQISSLYKTAQVPAPNLAHEDLYNQLVKELETDITSEEKKLILLKKNAKVVLKELSTLEDQKERVYNVEEHPEYLVFEYFDNKLLRQEQVDTIEKSKISGSGIELIMGAGKTAVIGPLVALHDAAEGYSPVLVMPEPIFRSVSALLQGTFKNSFNHLIEVFDFSRKQKLNLPALEHIEDSLMQAKKEKKVILQSGESFQNLFLIFLEKYFELVEPETINRDNPHIVQEFNVLRRILVHLGKTGNLTLDELDSLLDVLKAQHFTWGLGVGLSPDLSNTIVDLYQFLATDTDLANHKDAIKWNFLPGSKGAPFTLNRYNKIKPEIIKKVLEGKVRPKVLAPFLSSATAQEKQWVENYLTGKGDQKEIYGHIANLARPVRATLAVLKEEIHTILPLTAKKQLNMHHGPIPKGKASSGNSKYMSIPYHGTNNPILGAQAGTDPEIANYAIQMYLEQGISQEIIQIKLDQIREKFHKEGQVNAHSQVFKTEFARIGGQPHMNLLDLSKADLKEIYKFVNADRKLQFEFIRDHILPDFKTYRQQLRTNGQIYPLLIDKIKGFSGTLWNQNSYPTKFSHFTPSDTEEKTLMRLFKDSSKEVKVIQEPFQHNNIRPFLEELYKDFDGSFIDLGGMVRGVSNQAFAKELLDIASKNNPSILGVVFYDDSNQICLQMKDKILAFEEAKKLLTPDQWIIFWDQKHTTGSDIKAHPLMKAYMSFNRHTMMRDLLQGISRLRELDNGQRGEFIIHPEDRQAIQETLSTLRATEAINDDLKTPDLFLYAKYIEALRQGDDNFRALPQKLEAVLMQPVLKIMLDPEQNVDTLKELCPIAKELFMLEKPEDPFELYGLPQESVGFEEAAKGELDKVLNSKTMEYFRNHSHHHVDVNRLETRLDEIVQKGKAFLPQQIQKKGKAQADMEVQVESQLNENIETNIKINYRQETPQARPVVLWPLGNHFSAKYFNATTSDLWENKKAVPETHTVPTKLNMATELLPNKKQLTRLKGPAPLVSVSELLSSESTASLPISADLWASLNVMPIYPPEGSQHNFKPFDEFQGVSRNALVTRERATGKLRYVMLDPWDVLQWTNILKEEREHPPETPRDTQVCLHHWDLGLYAEGAEAFPEEELEKKEFHALTAQAKFLSGEMNNYKEQELESLRPWIAHKNVRKFFCDTYLKDKNCRPPADSDLAKVFPESQDGV